MLKKIDISNVGRFKSASTEGDEQFLKQYTFIYGRNTFGKSTLTAIFRSLKENNADYIIGRKTIGAQKQVIKITSETNNEYRYSTNEGKWIANYENILVFDNNFVRENIYTQTQQIGQDQQKNIELFMLGQEGFEYNIKITELEEKIANNTAIQKAINKEYSGNKHLLGNLEFDKFLALEKTGNIEDQIKNEKVEQDKIKNYEIISNKLNHVRSLLEKYIVFDSSTISDNLSINSEIINQYFSNHINKEETKQVYESFLQLGSKLRLHGKSESCPFCTQKIEDVKAKEFIETIDSIYDDRYRNLQRNIKLALDLFSKDNLSTEIEKTEKDLKSSGHVSNLDYSTLYSFLTKCKESIINKRDNLNIDLDNQPFLNLSKEASSLISQIDAELKKFESPSEKNTDIEQKLNILLAKKERHDAWKERCDNYLAAKTENEKLSKEKKKIWEDYQAYVSGLSNAMLSDINSILQASNCNFTVKQFSFRGNQRRDLFVLSVNEYPIANNGKESEITIKNCLSDSDKWILALSFFLAAVKHDKTVETVVVDDPVSSFDVDRKRIVLKEILKVFSNSSKQLILLTHERGFYNLLHKEKIDNVDTTFLKIVFDPKTGSDLTKCSPDEDYEFMNEYNCCIFDMKIALESFEISTVKIAHSKIRPVIEHILKVKYPLELSKAYNTVEKMLSRLEDSGGPYETNSPRVEIQAVLANLSHHDNSGNGQYPIEELGVEDYKQDIRNSFQLIKTL